MQGKSKLPLLSVLGGALAVAGSLMPFAKVGFSGFGVSQNETIAGLDTDDGKIFLTLGIVVIVFSLIAWTVTSVGTRRALSIFALLGALVLAGGAIYDVLDIEEKVGLSALAEESGTTIEQLEAFGVTFETSSGIGLYLVAIGGVLAFLGAVASLISRGESGPVMVATPPTAAPPPSTTAPSTTATTTTPPPAAAPPPAPPPPPGTPPENP